MSYTTVNPFTGEKLRTYPGLSENQIEAILEKSETIFRSWRLTSFEERRAKFLSLAQAMDRKKQDLAQLATVEMGKTLKESQSEIEKCIKAVHYYIENAESFLKDQIVSEKDFQARVAYEPLGVLLAIMPWNFPYWQVFRFAIPSLMAGNTALLKHASNTLGCAQAIAELFKEAEFPDGVFTHLVASHEQVEKILSDPRVKGVSLTGSTRAGRTIGELAGRYLKKSVLELGGSDPYVILADADVELAVDKCVQSRLINNGQSCIAAKRFIIHESLFETVLEKMKHKFSSLHMGDPLQASTQLGPVARDDLKQGLLEQVHQAKEEGAKSHLNLQQKADEQYPKACFVAPEILTGVKVHHAAFKKEFFGPVAMLFSFKEEAEAMKLANATPFGLGGAVFSQDIGKAQELARKHLNSGCVFVNDLVRSDPRLAFGGVKSSGYGRELGPFGIHEFVNIKALNF